MHASLGVENHRHNESEDVSLLSQEPPRKHIVDMHSYHFFMVPRACQEAHCRHA